MKTTSDSERDYVGDIYNYHEEFLPAILSTKARLGIEDAVLRYGQCKPGRYPPDVKRLEELKRRSQETGRSLADLRSEDDEAFIERTRKLNEEKGVSMQRLRLVRGLGGPLSGDDSEELQAFKARVRKSGEEIRCASYEENERRLLSELGQTIIVNSYLRGVEDNVPRQGSYTFLVPSEDGLVTAGVWMRSYGLSKDVPLAEEDPGGPFYLSDKPPVVLPPELQEYVDFWNDVFEQSPNVREVV